VNKLKKHPILYRANKTPYNLTNLQKAYLKHIKESEFGEGLFIKEHGQSFVCGGDIDNWVRTHEKYERKYNRKYRTKIQ